MSLFANAVAQKKTKKDNTPNKYPLWQISWFRYENSIEIKFTNITVEFSQLYHLEFNLDKISKTVNVILTRL